MGEGEMERPGIAEPMANLYDVFVDWESRLGREMPALVKWLRAADAKRVLDVGCGTGRHLAALLDEGFDAHGADVSEPMLQRARELIGEEKRLHQWQLGEPVSDSLRDQPPFDAVISMGNVWPALLSDEDVDRALSEIHSLLPPGGRLLLGLKAYGVRKMTGNPYLPLLRRRHRGQVLHFVRFCDFGLPARADDVEVCDFHMMVVSGGEGKEPDPRMEIHTVRTMRAWMPDELAGRVRLAGFAQPQVSARIDSFDISPTGEDVFLHAQRSTAP